MDGLQLIASRPVVISGAVLGALISMLGPMALKKCGVKNSRVLSTVTRLGYAISWMSVGLFIAAGFLSSY
ncbi:MAG TPA: hypothetical protein DCY55_13490 [Gammaproteobacteria bacterium]|jgi:hypothetical protein|nr:hypothetical protein [Gammaproteobacteria bacterium]